MAARIKPLLDDALSPCQYCGVRDNTMLSAISAIRDSVAEAELTQEPICILSLDFKDAFDCVAHEYLYTVLEKYGFDDWFIKRI